MKNYTFTSSDALLQSELENAKTIASSVVFAYSCNPSNIKSAMHQAMTYCMGRVNPAAMELAIVQTWQWYWDYLAHNVLKRIP